MPCFGRHSEELQYYSRLSLCSPVCPCTESDGLLHFRVICMSKSELRDSSLYLNQTLKSNDYNRLT